MSELYLTFDWMPYLACHHRNIYNKNMACKIMFLESWRLPFTVQLAS